MPKTAKDVMLTALQAISNYIKNYKPEGEAKLKAQLDVINEIAIAAMEEAEYVENQKPP